MKSGQTVFNHPRGEVARVLGYVRAELRGYSDVELGSAYKRTGEAHYTVEIHNPPGVAYVVARTGSVTLHLRGD